jgi:hypothetical protein
MGTLNINFDDETIKTYQAAPLAKKKLVKKVISLFVRQDTRSLKQALASCDHSDEELLEQAIHFAGQHRVFPLDYENHKMSREEMNER